MNSVSMPKRPPARASAARRSRSTGGRVAAMAVDPRGLDAVRPAARRDGRDGPPAAQGGRGAQAARELAPQRAALGRGRSGAAAAVADVAHRANVPLGLGRPAEALLELAQGRAGGEPPSAAPQGPLELGQRAVVGAARAPAPPPPGGEAAE